LPSRLDTYGSDDKGRIMTQRGGSLLSLYDYNIDENCVLRSVYFLGRQPVPVTFGFLSLATPGTWRRIPVWVWRGYLREPFWRSPWPTLVYVNESLRRAKL
jgi:hypothetical protein